jgi:hypothetical protein
MSDNKDEQAIKAWRRTRILVIGLCTAMAGVDAAREWYGWAAAWLGLGALNVWLDQNRKK